MLSNDPGLRKPRSRGRFRSLLGKEIYIAIRKWSDLISGNRWSRPVLSPPETLSLISHRTPLIRKLRAVDMELQYNKVQNLRLALQRLNGTLIRPGETFSVWRLVGRPSRRKGYLDGLVLKGGEVGRGVGGGLCQLGNLIYWMALHTELTVSERWRHSYDVFPDVDRKLPFGSGATLSYNYVDLRLRNDTARTYLLKLSMDEEFLIGEICCDTGEPWTWQVYESDHRFERQWWGGVARCNRIWRKRISKEGAQEEVFLVAENAALLKYEPMLPAGISEPGSPDHAS